jgi:hypothetical protein
MIKKIVKILDDIEVGWQAFLVILIGLAVLFLIGD